MNCNTVEADWHRRQINEQLQPEISKTNRIKKLIHNLIGKLKRKWVILLQVQIRKITWQWSKNSMEISIVMYFHALDASKDHFPGRSKKAQNHTRHSPRHLIYALHEPF